MTIAVDALMPTAAAGQAVAVVGPNLVAIAEGLGSSLPIEPLAVPGDSERRYVRLLGTEAYEAWLIEWPPTTDLELHDHGGSSGAFHVAEGRLVEAHTDLAFPGPLETLHLEAGETREVSATRVHKVWNPGPGTARSVHVYSPPLAYMTFYGDDPTGFLFPLRTEVVSGSPEGGEPNDR